MAGLFFLALGVILFAAVVDGVQFLGALDFVFVFVGAGGDVLANCLGPAKLTLLFGADLVLDLGAAEDRT